MQPCDTIGSHLCERLLAEGNDIICIDNYFTGHKSNIRHLLSHPNFEIIRHDIVYPYMAEIEEIYGDGGQSRSFQYIDDLIEGMVRMMDDTPDDFTGPVNIGNPNEFTIAELAREVISLTGSKSKIVHLPLPADDPQQRQPDISLARNMLGGWEPKIQLRDGLLKTIAYFEEVLSRGGIRR